MFDSNWLPSMIQLVLKVPPQLFSVSTLVACRAKGINSCS